MTTRLILLLATITLLPACTPARTQPAPTADLAQLEDRLNASEEKVAQLSQTLARVQMMVDRHERALQGTDSTEETTEARQPSSEQPVIQVPAELPLVETSSTAPESSDSPAISIALPETDTVVPLVMETASPGTNDADLEKPASDSTPNMSYDQAMEIFKSGDYDQAAKAFVSFAEAFPEDTLADNALYWAGECRYTKKKFDEAISLFKRVVNDYPSGSKVPDALLKIGYAYISLGDNDSAASYLKQVIARYPFSTAGSKAEERLKKLQ